MCFCSACLGLAWLRLSSFGVAWRGVMWLGLTSVGSASFVLVWLWFSWMSCLGVSSHRVSRLGFAQHFVSWRAYRVLTCVLVWPGLALHVFYSRRCLFCFTRIGIAWRLWVPWRRVALRRDWLISRKSLIHVHQQKRCPTTCYGPVI